MTRLIHEIMTMSLCDIFIVKNSHEPRSIKCLSYAKAKSFLRQELRNKANAFLWHSWQSKILTQFQIMNIFTVQAIFRIHFHLSPISTRYRRSFHHSIIIRLAIWHRQEEQFGSFKIEKRSLSDKHGNVFF